MDINIIAMGAENPLKPQRKEYLQRSSGRKDWYCRGVIVAYRKWCQKYKPSNSVQHR